MKEKEAGERAPLHSLVLVGLMLVTILLLLVSGQRRASAQLVCSPAAPPGTALNMWGQTLFTTSASGIALDRFKTLADVHTNLSFGKIFVSDSLNQWILRFFN